MKNSTRINRALAAKKKFFLFLTLLTLSVGQMWGADVVVTLDNIGANLTSTANTTAATTAITATGTTDSYTLNYYQCKKQGNSMFMTKSVSPYISNKTAMPGNIKSVEVFINSGAAGKTTYDCAFSTTECTSATSGIGAVNITGGNSHTYSNLTNNAINVKGKYFCVTLGNANNGQVLKLVITCEGSTNPDPVAVTGVTLDESTITLDPGDTQLLTATVAPNDASNKTVSWTSSNTSVATVDAGLVTAVAAGEATITATTQDGSFTDECTVTVTDVTKSSLIFTAACGGSGTADDDAEWEVTSDAAESNFDSSRGIHYGTNNSAAVQYVRLTTSDISGTITKVVVNASDATGTAEISVSVGGTDFTCSGSTTVTNSNPGSNYTFTGSASGEIIVLVDRGSAAYKAIYVKSVIVTYESCTPLGSINGSIDMSQTSATLTWDDLEGVAASNPYAVTYRKGSEAYGSANVGDITTNAQGKKTCTITGLECGTEYDFKIAVTGDGSHCDAEQVLEDQSTTKWNINYNLTNTVALSEGPAQGANACGEISASFTKNALYTFPENITVTIGDVEASSSTDYDWDANEGELLIDAAKVTGNVVIAIEGVAPANPVVTPNPAALNFASVKKGAAVPAAQDIEITGQNLTTDLTVTSSDPALYAVSVKSGSLTPDGDKNASPVITVTPQEGITSTAGDKNATITISGGGLASNVVVNVTFNVQETYTVNWYVNGTKIDANSKTDVEGTSVTAPSDFSTFTDCSELHFVGWATSAIAVAGTTTEPELVTPITAIGTNATTNYYAVFAEGTPASEVELMNEDFANELSNDNSNAYGTTNGGSKPAGFTGALDKAYAGKNGTAKLGSSSAAGYITSKSLDLSEAFSVSIKVKRYNDTDGGNVEITIDGDNDTKQVISNDDINSSTFESFKLNFDAATSTSTIKIATSTKRAYIDDVVVSQASDPVWTKWYTTCPHVSRVTLNAADVENGSISFAKNEASITSIVTAGENSVTVDVVPDPATGYELTGVALSGVAGASYAEGVITIPQDAEGTLTVTATFAQKNYSIAVETYPENIGATLGGATSTAKYGVEQTISTDEPTGYIFGGWYIYDAEDTEKETDLSEEIFTGTYEGQELELSASFLMPDKNLVAEAYFDKIYTVNEFAELSKTNNETYYIEGLICKINGFYNSKYISYLISVDGVNSGNTVLVYNGSGLNGVDFTAASDLSIGDKVIVAGKWNTSNSRINNSKQISYTAAALSALAIVGDASVTTYDVGDSFDNTGLSVTATYNTGYVVTNYDATITSDYDAPTTFTAGVTSVTVSASEGLINTERVIPITVSSAVLDYAELASGYQTEFWAKESYKEPLLNAYLNDEPATVLANVTGVTDVSGLDMSVAGNKHVTITYTRKAVQTTTVGYDFTVKPVVVDEAHAHSVSTAREIIDVDLAEKAASATGLDLAEEDTKTHVIGVVKSVSGSSPYSIVIKDQTDESLEMTLYQVTLKSGITNVAVDDVIKAYGNLYYYANNSKYEINTGGQVVAVVRTPNLTVADVAEMEINITADLGVDDLTIDRDGSNGDITFACTNPAVTIVNNKLHAAAAGDATVTATIAADGIYTEASTTFNVHVIAERTRYTVTFDANGADGGSAPVAIANQLEGATVDLPVCSYSWAKHGFTGWKVINLSTSAEIEVENNQFTMPAANVKIQAQWEEIATTHIVFNVNGNTETVAAVDVPQAVEYSITQVTDGQNGYEFVGWAENPETEDVEEAIATIESYTPEAGEASKTLYAVFKRVDEGAPKTDVLTAADFAATTNSYVEFSGVSKTSNAVYAGNSAKNNAGSIQLRSKNSDSGIVTTSTGGILKSVTINVGSGSATIDVYGSNTAYSAATDLYGSAATQGTKIGSTSTTNTIDVAEDYKYVGIRANDNTIYLSSVEITWQPKTTYYTTAPSAVYAVSYVLGEGGAWAGDACDGANVKAGKTFDICESVPVREHYKFVKWQVAGEDVSGTITINAATAITAIWEAKVENDITYNAGTGTGDDAVVGSNEEGAEIVLPSAADKSLSKEGYDFVGWLYGGDLYEAGTIFEMPASAVTFVAQWKKQNITKMTLVTDVAQLVDGSKVVIAQAEITDDCKTMGKQNTNNRSAVASTVDGNVLSVGEGTSEFTLVTLENNQFAFQASNGNYLYAASTGNNYLREQAAIDGNASWTISIASNGVATIKAQGSNTNNWMRYNSGSKLFSCYGSGQQDIAIYANVTAITDDASISDIGYVEGDVIVVSSGATLTMDAPSAPASITVKENAVVNVSAATEAGTVIVEKGAKLAIEEGGSVTTNEPLVLYTTLGKGTGTNTSGNAPGSSSEIINAERLNATGDVFIEIELTQDAKASAGWYAFSVPFPVDAMNGVYYGDTKLTNEVGYAIMSHYGELRAKDEYAWKKFRGIMQPGVFYVITVGNTDYKTLRFKKVADEALVASSSVAVSPFPTQTGNNADGAWNGIGNPNLAISNLSTAVTLMQFYDHKTNTFIGRSHSVNLVVGSAFFIQYNGGETVSIPVGTTDYEGVLAPRREQKAVEEMIYEVQLTNVATGELEDNVFLTAREDAKNEYEIGRDVAKLSMGTAKCAQMWVPAYGTKLCAADFQLLNDKAEYPLTLNAPSAGTYSISMVENDAATIYLTYEGSIIWNLSMSAYELTLEKGTTEGYGLLLNAKMPMTPTGVETIDNSQFTIHNCQKVIIDEHVYILRGGQMYDVTGKAVK